MKVAQLYAVLPVGDTRPRSSTARVAMAAVVVATATVWAATYAAGGSKSAVPHFFYVPVIIAAARFRAVGALVVSVAVGLVSGPLMPLDVATGAAQSWGNWVARLAAFVTVGQLTAFACRHSSDSIRYEFTAAVLRRRVDHALASGEFRIEYQPIVDIGHPDERIVGVEALLRWDDAQRGPIAPDQFIPQAERAGCIAPITRFVVTEVCRQVDEWRTTVLAGRRDFIVAINISGSELADHHLVLDVEAILAAHEVPVSWVHLEITETALVHDVDGAAAGLRRLRDLGLKLALDDFGTGESSLGHLHRFAIDVLKIDRVFLQRLERHDRGHMLIDGIVELARKLDVVTVAEGIETPSQALIVRDSGCDLAQGYLFARPCAPGRIEELLADPDRWRRELHQRYQAAAVH